MIKQLTILTAALAFGSVYSGCASPSGSDRMDRTVSTMTNAEQTIENGEERLETLVVALDRFDDAEDLDRAYRAYDRATDDLESTAQSIRSQRVAMQTRAAEHTMIWQTEASQLENDQARRVARERRDEFESSITQTGSELDDLYAAYRDLIDKTEALETVLANDLTHGGIEASSELRREIAEMARELRAQSVGARESVRDSRVSFAR